MPESTEQKERSPADQREHDLKMLAWMLTYRIPMAAMLTVGHLRWGGRWLFTPGEVEQMPATEPDWFLEVVQGRQRRRDFAARHGRCPDNWTPPEGWEALPECKPPPLRMKLARLERADYQLTRSADTAAGETRTLKQIRQEQREDKTRGYEFICELSGKDPTTEDPDPPRKPRKPSRPR